ncbi:MAG: hypothetical protein AB7O60_15220 [Variibacter sp.]
MVENIARAREHLCRDPGQGVSGCGTGQEGHAATVSRRPSRTDEPPLGEHGYRQVHILEKLELYRLQKHGGLMGFRRQ